MEIGTRPPYSFCFASSPYCISKVTSVELIKYKCVRKKFTQNTFSAQLNCVEIQLTKFNQGRSFLQCQFFFTLCLLLNPFVFHVQVRTFDLFVARIGVSVLSLTVTKLSLVTTRLQAVFLLSIQPLGQSRFHYGITAFFKGQLRTEPKPISSVITLSVLLSFSLVFFSFKL